jgi:hypothetical protein
MHSSERFPFTVVDQVFGEASLLPQLPLTLNYRGRSANVMGLLDTGAAINVLPYSVGVNLGAVWEQQRIEVSLSGNLSLIEARALVVFAALKQFKPVRLVFAWAHVDNIRLILGQVNFFTEFDVCFYRAQQFFEVGPKD